MFWKAIEKARRDSRVRLHSKTCGIIYKQSKELGETRSCGSKTRRQMTFKFGITRGKNREKPRRLAAARPTQVEAKKFILFFFWNFETPSWCSRINSYCGSQNCSQVPCVPMFPFYRFVPIVPIHSLKFIYTWMHNITLSFSLSWRTYFEFQSWITV